MRQKDDKRYAQIVHAQRRAQERLGIPFNKEQRLGLIARIKHGKLRFLYRQSVRVSVFRDTINGKEIDVVYDKIRHEVITFLYPEEESVYEKLRTGEGATRKENAHYISPTKKTPRGVEGAFLRIQKERAFHTEGHCPAS